MNNEIKEILDNVRKCCDITKEQSFVVYQRQDILKLLDYIINLQQKAKYYEETQTFGDYVKEVNLLIDYKSRIEKAVEYIEKSKEINYKTIDTLSEEAKLLKGILNGENVMLNNILNILNGRGDE